MDSATVSDLKQANKIKAELAQASLAQISYGEGNSLNSEPLADQRFGNKAQAITKEDFGDVLQEAAVFVVYFQLAVLLLLSGFQATGLRRERRTAVGLHPDLRFCPVDALVDLELLPVE